MRAMICSPIKDKSDMWFMSDDDFIYHIKEGTGDALDSSDIDDGYVDYIYIDVYKNNLTDIHEDNIFDGGMILLKKPYKDMSIEDILATVETFFNVGLFTAEDDVYKNAMDSALDSMKGGNC